MKVQMICVNIPKINKHYNSLKYIFFFINIKIKNTIIPNVFPKKVSSMHI